VKALGPATTHYNRVVLGLFTLAVVLVTGTAGYMIIEDWSLLDAAYMASITITTVGYSEVRPLSQSGQIFTIGLMFLGVGTAFYILTALVATIIEGDLRQIFGARRMKSMIERLQDHYIVCGYGRVGEQVAMELQVHRAAFVLVENNEPRIELARQAGLLVVQGDATAEETLVEAGIHRCRALIAASDSDSTNTYITLTAKGLRPETYVVARVGSEAVEAKLTQAGADRVVSPYRIGGRRMAFAALQPIVTDFIDIFPTSDQGDRILAEITVEEESGFAGKQLGEALAGCEDLVVLAVRDAAGQLNVGPPRSRVLIPGEILIVVGGESDLSALGFSGRRRTETPLTGVGGSGLLARFLRRH
jgi:voltage-gated potassium channel